MSTLTDEETQRLRIQIGRDLMEPEYIPTETIESFLTEVAERHSADRHLVTQVYWILKRNGLIVQSPLPPA